MLFKFSSGSTEMRRMMNQIEVYGTGCDKFFETVKNIEKVLDTCKVNADFSTVTDRDKIIKKGFTNLPAVIINNKLISQGIVLSVEIIEKELTRQDNAKRCKV